MGSLSEIPESVLTDGKLTRVPNQPKTPKRSFRIPDDLFLAVQAKAAERGVSVSEIIRECLMHFLEECSRDEPEPGGDGQS